MNQHVPGVDTPERPLGEQADILTKKLAGHETFARMRGKVVGYPMWNLLDPESGTSPTRSLKEFDEFVRGVRVMRNLIVWLRWHGCRRAAEEVLHALNGGYRMWCEEVSLDASVPATLLMFRPEEVSSLARWWARKETSSELWSAFSYHIMERRGQKFEPRELSADTMKYLEQFPSLRKDNDSSATLFSSLRATFVDPILNQASSVTRGEFDHHNMGFAGPNYPLYMGKVAEVNHRKGYQGGAFAYFFPRKEQGEVLSWFPRAVQKHLATWQLRVPETSLCGVVQLRIGLYPESEQKLWQKLYPSLTSKGVAHGLGVLFSPRDEFCDGERLALKSW